MNRSISFWTLLSLAIGVFITIVVTPFFFNDPFSVFAYAIIMTIAIPIIGGILIVIAIITYFFGKKTK